jgi:photosystem II stability/assembly factor-like uncharacterized protein
MQTTFLNGTEAACGGYESPMKTNRKALTMMIAVFVSTFVLSSLFNPIRRGESEREGDRSGALQALEAWTAARAYPAADIPPDRYYAAYLSVKQHVRNADALLPADTVWQFIGPNNFSGRMISVAVNPLNPNTIYAGSAAGGLWRSYSEGLGNDWHRISTGYPVLGVNAIAIDPVDTNTMYIGTGEVYRYQGSVGGMIVRTTRGSVGMGILKTTDGGQTWSRSLDWSYNQQRGVQALRFNPLNRNTVYAATTEGLYRTTDAGSTWTPLLEILMARDIVIHPHDTMNIMATFGNFSSAGAGVYRSTDGGASFEQMTALPSFSGMAVLGMFPASPDTVFASLSDSTITVGSIWRTTDFGTTWQLRNTDNNSDVQGWYSRFLAVHPTDLNQIVRGAQGLSKSTNGGTSFTGVFDCWADYHSYAYHPTDSDILYVADDGGIWRSTNFGASYVYAGNGLETSQFYNGFSSSATDSLRALGQVQDHFGWMYTGSKTWQDGGVDEVGWTAINQSNDFIMYAGSRGGGALYKSVDRGQSFSWSSNGMNGGVSAWNAPFIISSSNPNVLYFGRSLIFKTQNAAGNWTATNGGSPLDGNPAMSMAMSFNSTDTVYVGTAPRFDRSHIFRTTNGGTSWEDITGVLPDRYPMDIAVDPRDGAVVYIAYGGFDTSHVFTSTDAGGTWRDITGVLPDVPATALIVDPDNTQIVYCGTDIGLFVSTNGGDEWMSWGGGLPEGAIISDLSISPSNRALRAVTHSNGIYERSMLELPTTDIEGGPTSLPATFALHQNYPNPFNPATTISFTLASAGHVTLAVYDILGKRVTTLVDEHRGPGLHHVQWDAQGKASGVYYYTLAAGSTQQARRMVLSR